MRIEWDKTGEKIYETGVKNGVLYSMDDTGKYGDGVAWNGLSSVTESPSGAEPNKIYADDQVYVTIIGAEEFGGTIEAYMYPDEFEKCDGSKELAPGIVIGQQDRAIFGLSYVTTKGNDIKGNSFGKKIHLMYGLTAQPSERQYQTINDSVEPNAMSWELQSTPVNVTGFKPTSLLTIDTTKADADKVKALEDVLYGTDSDKARLPLPDEVMTIVGTPAIAG